MTALKKSRGWREDIAALEGLPLLPCGAGESGKAPLVAGWQNKAFSPPEIEKFGDQLRCVGLRCGPVSGGLIAIDLDGASAVELAREKLGRRTHFDDTWMIGRSNAEDRLKLVYRIDHELWDGLPGKVVLPTGKGEQIEFFWSSGQVVVLGEHVSTGGEYLWLGNTGPDSICPLPDEMWQLLQDTVERSATRSSGSGSSSAGMWRDAIPCPICGRTTPDCRIHKDGQTLLCHYGRRWHPPVLAKGETAERNGVTWAYCGDKTTAPGMEAALFRIEQQQPQAPLRKQHRVRAGEAQQLMTEALDGERPMLNVRSRGIHCGGREFTSQEIEHLYLDLSRGPNEWSQRLARDTFLKLGSESEFDPVAVWLHNLRAEPLEDDDWRDLGRLLFDLDDDIADQFLPRYLVSAVARVISPGCLVRQTPVLLGPQGVGKTEAGRALFGHDWYGDGLSSELGIDDITLLQQCWGLELGELNGIVSKTQKEKLKAFLTRRVDLARRKYGTGTESIPRRSVFFGTTNKSPLADNTGSSRFVMIPLPDRKLPVERIWQFRESIWQRAYLEYRNHAQWFSTEDEMAQIVNRNEEFDLVDPWHAEIGAYLARHSSAGYIQLRDIYQHLKIDIERQSGGNANRISELMKSHGWVQSRRRVGDSTSKVRAFFPDRVDRG